MLQKQSAVKQAHSSPICCLGNGARRRTFLTAPIVWNQPSKRTRYLFAVKERTRQKWNKIAKKKMDLEDKKENIQPLRGGRNVEQLEYAFVSAEQWEEERK